MKIIENLFYGNICPSEKVLTRGSKYSHLLQLAVKNEEKLHSILSPQQTEQFEKLKEYIIDMNNISEKEAFVDGFRLGVQLIAESIYEIFVNAQIHSSTDYIYTCGQFFPRKHKIEFTIVDTGIGFKNAINNRFNGTLSSIQAMKWALKDGITTKKIFLVD